MRGPVASVAALVVALCILAPAHAGAPYAPDYACGGALDPTASTETDVCSIALTPGLNRVDVLMPFLQRGTYRVRIQAPSGILFSERCTSVEEISYGSWQCAGESGVPTNDGGSSGLLWADGWVELRVPAKTVLTLSAGDGIGFVSVRGRVLSA